MEYSNVLLCNNIGKIGGIETFLWEIAKKYGDLDITVFYTNADSNQLNRLRKKIRCVRLTEPIKCKRCFMMYKVGTDMVEAEEYIQMIHANYKVQNLMVNVDPKITRYLAVSKWVGDAYEELLRAKGVYKPVEVCYNPITVEEPKKVLKLISPTRLTREKGKDRMTMLGNMLQQAKIPFIWLVFTDDFNRIDVDNVIYMPPRLDIREYIKAADYLVQLSDTEGCPYSILESLTLGTPVLCTPIPSMLEIGVKDGETGYVLPFDMQGIDLDKIYNKIPKFKYTPPKDKYDELFIHTPSTYNTNEDVDVKAIRGFQDSMYNVWRNGGDVFRTTRERANELIEGKYVVEI